MFERTTRCNLDAKKNETRWRKKQKDDDSRRIAISVSRVRSPPLFSSSSFLFFFERVTLIGWMRVVPRLRLLDSRNLSHEGELAGQATSERKKRIDVQSIMFYRLDSGRSAKISLLLFPIASTDPTDPIVGNSFERDDAANLGFLRYLVFFFFFFYYLGNVGVCQ